jgi:hypothetical protein
MLKNLLTLIAIVSLCSITFGQTDKEAEKSKKKSKISVEEIVSKHLASIGTPEALSAVKSRIMVGNVKATSRLNFVGQFAGVAQFASAGEMVVLAMVFDSSVYQYEKAGFDGKKITVGLAQGDQSLFGDYLKSQDDIIKEGLLGGVLSSNWALQNVQARKAKLIYAGTVNINDRQLYKVKYVPNNGGGGLTISLYFDVETFHHVRNEYQYVISPGIGVRPGEGIGATNNSERKYKLTENFSGFKTEGQLTLPHKYWINLTVDSGITRSIDWVMEFSQFIYNQDLDSKVFRIA